MIESLFPFEAFTGADRFNEKYLIACQKAIQLCFEVIEQRGLSIPYLDLLEENFHSVCEGGGVERLPFHRITDQQIYEVQLYLTRSIHGLFEAIHNDWVRKYSDGNLLIDVIKALYTCGYNGVVKGRALPMLDPNNNLQVNHFTHITEAEAIVVNILKDELGLA